MIRSQYQNQSADFSPDGKWIVFESDDSGRFQIYITSFPAPSGRWQVSTDGGTQPIWRGNEIFFINASQLWAAEVRMLSNSVIVAAPKPLFSAAFTGLGLLQYDASADGKRFVVNAAENPSASPLNITLNWQEELKK